MRLSNHTFPRVILFACALFGWVNASPAQIAAVWAQTSAPTNGNNGWAAVACSADGTQVMAAQPGNQGVYISTNSGSTWAPHPLPGGGSQSFSQNGHAIACSSNGTTIAIALFTGPLYVSSDSGTTWSGNAPNNHWTAVTCSPDGTKLAAAGWGATGGGGQIWISTNSGSTWTPHGPTETWTDLASSSDGTKLAAVSGQIYTSTDSGSTWTARETAQDWTGIASSSDGTTLVACDDFDTVVGGGGLAEVQVVPIPIDCVDGFTEAYYARPEAFLDPAVRRSQSAWSFVKEEDQLRFVKALSDDLKSGNWDRKFGEWRAKPSFDGSPRLIVRHCAAAWRVR